MNRKEFQEIARVRLEEAKLLLRSGKYDGAYYLSGYVIECALKACIAKQVKRYDFPNKQLAQDCYTHDLVRLINIAGLRTALDSEVNLNSDFASNWATVKDWREESRYQRHTLLKAQAIFEAISHRRNGVFKWVRQHW